MNIMRYLFLCLTIFAIPFAHATQEVAYLFAHGLYNDYTLAYYYENIGKAHTIHMDNDQMHLKYKSGHTHTWTLCDPQDVQFWIIRQPHTFNFPDATRKGFDGSQTSLGQENEIQTLANAYERIKHNQVILMGMSRGASTILNFLGTKNADAVVAAIVESPFDSITNTLENLCKFAGASWLMPLSILHTCPNLFFGKFNPRGIFPIKVVHNINKDLPILIIASLQDELIPAHNIASIYNKLRDNEHQHVYFLLLDKGPHAYLLEHEDAHIYLNTVHAFYKKYNLPHNQTFAAQGELILCQCQPSKKVIDEALKNKKTFIKK